MSYYGSEIDREITKIVRDYQERIVRLQALLGFAIVLIVVLLLIWWRW